MQLWNGLQIGIYRADARNAKCRVQNAELGLRREKTTHAVIPTKRSAWRDLFGNLHILVSKVRRSATR